MKQTTVIIPIFIFLQVNLSLMSQNTNDYIAPYRYASIIDRHLYNVGKPQIYHTLPFFICGLSKEEREIVNSNRESIGMKKLEEVTITSHKNTVTVKYK